MTLDEAIEQSIEHIQKFDELDNPTRKYIAEILEEYEYNIRMEEIRQAAKDILEEIYG